MAEKDSEPGESWGEEERKKDPVERMVSMMENTLLPGMRRQETHQAFGGIATIRSHDQISIRKIRNGFLMSYYEAAPQAVPGMPEAKVYAPKHAEVFFRTADEVGELIKPALAAAELLSKSAELIAEAYRDRLAGVPAYPSAFPA